MARSRSPRPGPQGSQACWTSGRGESRFGRGARTAISPSHRPTCPVPSLESELTGLSYHDIGQQPRPTIHSSRGLRRTLECGDESL
jgi:hypothetical protein